MEGGSSGCHELEKWGSGCVAWWLVDDFETKDTRNGDMDVEG